MWPVNIIKKCSLEFKLLCFNVWLNCKINLTDLQYIKDSEPLDHLLSYGILKKLVTYKGIWQSCTQKENWFEIPFFGDILETEFPKYLTLVR